MKSQLWSLGAAELAHLIRGRDVSSVEVVRAHLDRIDAVGSAVNAVTCVQSEAALAAAAGADAALAAGEQPGPLHGVPFTVKENVDVRGSATTHGVPALRDALPDVDAPGVAHLRAAGAIPIARTNLPDFGLRWHTESGLHGATLNPWDAERTAGGSSGGEAVALATGMTPLGIGNDYGGSLRVPATFCGVCAIRPTLGRVPDHDSQAPGDLPITGQLMAVQGPMARCVADLRLALGVMSERDPRDPWWTPAPLEGPVLPEPIRVAVVHDPGGRAVDPAVSAGVRRAAQALLDAGYEVREIDPPGLEQAAALWSELVFTEIGVTLLPTLQPLLSRGSLRFLEHALALRPPVELPRYIAALAERLGIARRFTLFQRRYPLILGPVCCEQAFRVGADVESLATAERVIESMRLATAVNLLGLPSVAVPVGLDAGLPQGVQLIGDRYREDLCLAAAEAIESRIASSTLIDPR